MKQLETRLLNIKKIEEYWKDCKNAQVIKYCSMYNTKLCSMICDYAKRGGR